MNGRRPDSDDFLKFLTKCLSFLSCEMDFFFLGVVGSGRLVRGFGGLEVGWFGLMTELAVLETVVVVVNRPRRRCHEGEDSFRPCVLPTSFRREEGHCLRKMK